MPIVVPLEFSRFRGSDVSPPEALPSNGITPLERAMLTLLTNIGFHVYSTRHAPFDALSRDEHDQLLTGASEYSPAVQRRAQFMSSFSRLAGAYSVFIIEGHAFTDRIGDTLLLRSDEMRHIFAKEQLLSRFH